VVGCGSVELLASSITAKIAVDSVAIPQYFIGGLQIKILFSINTKRLQLLLCL
jgi:hypothetical protein